MIRWILGVLGLSAIVVGAVIAQSVVPMDVAYFQESPGRCISWDRSAVGGTQDLYVDKNCNNVFDADPDPDVADYYISLPPHPVCANDYGAAEVNPLTGNADGAAECVNLLTAAPDGPGCAAGTILMTPATGATGGIHCNPLITSDGASSIVFESNGVGDNPKLHVKCASDEDCYVDMREGGNTDILYLRNLSGRVRVVACTAPQTCGSNDIIYLDNDTFVSGDVFLGTGGSLGGGTSADEDLYVKGDIEAGGTITGQAALAATLGAGGATDVTITFNSATDETLMWDYSEDMFVFSDDLAVSDTLRITAETGQNWDMRVYNSIAESNAPYPTTFKQSGVEYLELDTVAEAVIMHKPFNALAGGTFAGGITFSPNNITASTTQSQGQQQLVRQVNNVNVVANDNDVVTLMDFGDAGFQIAVNSDASETLQVYPKSGDNLGKGMNNSTTVAPGFALECWSTNANTAWCTQWAATADPPFTPTDIDTDYGDETVTSNWTFTPNATGDHGDTDLTIGGADYGLVQFGNVQAGATSFSAVNLDLDKAFLFRSTGNLGVGNDPGIEFAWMEQANTVRMAIPESGADNATAFIRSGTFAGPYTSTIGNDIVSCDQWTTYDANIDCDTSGTGADLFVQDDLEVEGTIFAHETINFEGATADGNQVILQVGADPGADVTISLPTATGTLITDKRVQHQCKTIENLVAADDDILLDVFRTNVTIVAVACESDAATQVILEDYGGADIETIACNTDGSLTWDETISGTATLVAGEVMRMLTDTESTPTWTMVCWEWTND